MAASKRGPYIIVFHGGKPGFHWHIRAANGEIICQGEGHGRRSDAERAAKTVVKRIIGSAPGLVLKFYKDANLTHGEVTRWTWIY